MPYYVEVIQVGIVHAILCCGHSTRDTGALPVNNSLLTGTVPVNNSLLTVEILFKTFVVNKTHLSNLFKTQVDILNAFTKNCRHFF